jgi:hypothetical protein
MSNAPRRTSFATGVSTLVALLIAGLTVCFCAAVEQSRNAPMATPGPVVIVVQQHYRDRVPGANSAPYTNGFERFHRTPRKHVRHGHRRDAEAAAYAKAYANARRANVLLGRQQYREHA